MVGFATGFSTTGFGAFAGSTMLGFASLACGGGVGRAAGGVTSGLGVAATLGKVVSAVILLFSRSTAIDAGEGVTGFAAPAVVDEADVVVLGLTGVSLADGAVATGDATDGQRCP